MQNVLIISKTSNGREIFLGGVNLNTNDNVQLGPGHVGFTHPKDVQMNVGEVWKLELGRFSEMEIRPPHTQNWNIIAKERTDKVMQHGEIKELILKRVGAPFVHPGALFDGHLDYNENGKGFIDLSGSLPQYSIGFWRFNDPLHLDYDNNENEDGTYYRSESGDFRVKYTGVANPEGVLPPGTVLRFFLSQSYEFMNLDVFWLLLSGWYI